MTIVLNEKSLDWALAHICRYCDSDHFPRIFEFSAIRENWPKVKKYILSINLDGYTPQPPLIRFAPRLNGTHRVVHRLDPIDSLIYAAMVHEMHETAEGPREPEPLRIVASRIAPSNDGSFFAAARNAWQQHVQRIESLAQQHKDGYVLMADVFDFFGQIQPRLLGQTLAESRSIRPDLIRALNRFLLALSPASSRGIPVGPAASAVLAEAIGASIDREILKHTRNFARWVDDLHVFFTTRQAAHDAMRDLGTHINTAHELIFAPEKTRVIPVEEFLARHHKGLADETVAAGPEEERLGQLAGRWRPMQQYYGWSTAIAAEPVPRTLCAQMQSLPEFRKVGDVYLMHFEKAVNSTPPDLLTARRIMRKAAAYRIRDLLPGVLGHFNRLMPVIREAGIYLKAVLNGNDIRTCEQQLHATWDNSQQASSYVSDWMCHVFAHPGFNQINLPADYSSLVGIRNQALTALRKKDSEWVRKQAVRMDAFDPWDRRAVLYACSVLPQGERASVLEAAQMHGTILERSVALYVKSACDRATDSASARARLMSPDNYPSYGDKPEAKVADNLTLLEEVEEMTLKIAEQENSIREQKAAIAKIEIAIDQKDAEIKSLNNRLAALEQIVDRLTKQEGQQVQ